MNATRQLEAAAVDAHHAGTSWGDFWGQHMRTGLPSRAPRPPSRFAGLVRRLSHLLTCGNLDSMVPLPDPWERDNLLDALRAAGAGKEKSAARLDGRGRKVDNAFGGRI